MLKLLCWGFGGLASLRSGSRFWQYFMVQGFGSRSLGLWLKVGDSGFVRLV